MKKTILATGFALAVCATYILGLFMIERSNSLLSFKNPAARSSGTSSNSKTPRNDFNSNHGQIISGQNSSFTARALTPLNSTLSDAEHALVEFDQFIDRYRRGDVTDEEIAAVEESARLAIMSSPEGRRLFAQRLAEAFRSGDALPLYSLERAFLATDSIPSLLALMDVYDDVVKNHGQLQSHAFQGLNQMHGLMSAGERSRYLELAMARFNSHSDLDSYMTSMQFMTETVSNALNNTPPVYAETVRRMIESRQLSARTEQEQFFTAQSMYRLLPQQQAYDFATNVLATQPTPGNIQAVLEAVGVNRLPFDAYLRDRLQASIGRTTLTDEQLALAQSVLGTQLSTPTNRGG